MKYVQQSSTEVNKNSLFPFSSVTLCQAGGKSLEFVLIKIDEHGRQRM